MYTVNGQTEKPINRAQHCLLKRSNESGIRQKLKRDEEIKPAYSYQVVATVLSLLQSWETLYSCLMQQPP